MHETIIFGTNGKIYKSDNKTLRTPETVYTYENGTIAIYENSNKTISDGVAQFKQIVYNRPAFG